MKIAILTAQAGNKGQIEDPKNGGFSSADYYAFTDKPLNLSVWHTRPTYNFSSETLFKDRRHAKLPKILGWLLVPGYDYYIWHDSVCDVAQDPREIVQTYLNHNIDIAFWPHPHRDCSYQECDTVELFHKESSYNVTATRQFLLDQQWPRHSGMFELSSFVYRNNSRMQAAMLSWWELVCRYSSRDQILWPFVIKQHQLNYVLMQGWAQAYAGNNHIIPQVRPNWHV